MYIIHLLGPKRKNISLEKRDHNDISLYTSRAWHCACIEYVINRIYERSTHAVLLLYSKCLPVDQGSVLI